MRTKTNIFPTNLRPECGAEVPTFLSDVYKRGTQAKKRQAYAPQKEKILRPECGAEAPTFLSAVYNKRYTREKLTSRYKQSGRSMIEMLGVLAIIGVLTVGSITGYSHAMRRHLLNKQREQISYILSAAETHHNMVNINTLDTPQDFTSIFKTFGWIPEEMIKDDTRYIYDVFKNQIYFYKWGNSHMGLVLHLETPNAYEQCTNLYQTIQQYHAFLYSTSAAKRINQHSSYRNGYAGDPHQHCIYDPKACIRNLTPTKISQLCQFCNDTEDNYCVLYILWK